MRHLMGFWALALKHRPVRVDSAEGSASSLVEVQGGATTLSSLKKQTLDLISALHAVVPD